MENKTHIKPKSQGQSNRHDRPYQPRIDFGREIDDLKKMVKNVKQQIRQLNEQEKDFDEIIGRDITLELNNGQERKGILKYYGKYNIEIQEGDFLKTYLKHAIMGYSFN